MKGNKFLLKMLWIFGYLQSAMRSEDLRPRWAYMQSCRKCCALSCTGNVNNITLLTAYNCVRYRVHVNEIYQAETIIYLYKSFSLLYS